MHGKQVNAGASRTRLPREGICIFGMPPGNSGCVVLGYMPVPVFIGLEQHWNGIGVLGNMLSRCTGQVDVGVHITVFGMAEINKAGEGHHEARAERFALECDPAQFLGGEIAPGLWIVAPDFPVGIGRLRKSYVAAVSLPLACLL